MISKEQFLMIKRLKQDGIEVYFKCGIVASHEYM